MTKHHATNLVDDFEIDTPEKRKLFQSLAQKLFNRVLKMNLNTPHDIHFVLSASSASECKAVSVELYWYVNDDLEQHGKPNCDTSCCYSWLESKDIEKWFLDANIGLDLLVAESKAA
ncbi:MAG: hypothetical protein GW890_00065 [Vibrio sp.]|nr:hypothetical protein [Vibrio sp.]